MNGLAGGLDGYIKHDGEELPGKSLISLCLILFFDKDCSFLTKLIKFILGLVKFYKKII